MKKICIYCEKWSSGGIESFIASVLSQIDLRDIQIDLVSCQIEYSPFTKGLIERGVKFHQLSGNRNNVLKNRYLFLQLMKRQQYDILHVNAFHGGSLYYLYLGKTAGIPKRIAHSHNSMLKKGLFSALKLAIHNIGKIIYAKYGTDLWACSSVAAHFLYPKSLSSQVVIIPNGIDVMRFQFSEDKRYAVRAGLDIYDEIILGHTGRFCQQKNQLFLLDVFYNFLIKHPNSKLLLVGDGEDKSRLINRVAKLGIEEKVIFTGITSHVEDFLFAMDVFLFPSIFEGLGIAVVEAQASGLPLICSDQVPMEAMLLPNVQRLPLKLDIEQWVQAVEKVCKISNKRDSCAALVKNKGYDIETVTAFIQNTYGGT